MDKAITTALLIIAGVVCMIFVFNSVYPMVSHSSQAMVSMAEQVDERMKSRINIVHAANSANRTSVYLWIKNIGTQRITDVDESDLFFGSRTISSASRTRVMPEVITRDGTTVSRMTPSGKQAPLLK